MSALVAHFLFLTCVFLSSFAQILMKLGAGKYKNGLRQYCNAYVLSGYGIFLSVTIGAAYLYRYIELSVGTALECCGYLFISVLGVICLDESWDRKKTVGLILIVSGVLCFSF